jgi:hypothetical protein
MSTVDPNMRVEAMMETTNRPAFRLSKIFKDSVPLTIDFHQCLCRLAGLQRRILDAVNQ